MQSLDSFNSDFDKVFKKYQKYNLKNDDIVDRFNIAGLDNIAEKINRCSEFSSFKKCLDCGSLHFVGTYLCKQRFCFVCAKKRGLVYLYKYGGLLKKYEDDGHELRFITLTMKNDSDLKRMMKKFNNDFKHFRFYDIWKDNVLGSVACRETTYNSADDEWHFHIHIIAIMQKGRDISNEDLAREWFKRTGDSYITDIRKTKKKKVDGEMYNTDFLELFKYPTKITELKFMPNERLRELYNCFFKARLISATGCLYGKVSEKDVEKEIEFKEERELKNLCCSVCKCDVFGDVLARTRDVKETVHRLELKDDIKKRRLEKRLK